MEVIEKETISARVEAALETMRPFLRADGGDVELVEVTEDMVVQLRLTGSCSNCQMSEMTMRAGIEEAIKRAVPEIKSVEAVK